MPKPKPLPDQSLLQALLRYDPLTGKLFWKERPHEMFNEEWMCRKWNTRYADTPALACVGSHGYLYGNILDQKFRAHRVIWKLVTGEEPDFIDHEDGNRTRNVWKNLRSTSRVQNNRNVALGTRNTSGVMGVSWEEYRQQWMVRLSRQHLGRYSCFGQAIKVRKAAERAAGYHENHGRAAA